MGVHLIIVDTRSIYSIFKSIEFVSDVQYTTANMISNSNSYDLLSNTSHIILKGDSTIAVLY